MLLINFFWIPEHDCSCASEEHCSSCSYSNNMVGCLENLKIKIFYSFLALS